MAKDKITDYDATASGNLDVGGVSVAEGMLPSGVNNAIRELMSHQKEAFGSGTPLYVDQVNNRVGIGTASPSQSLSLYANDTTDTQLIIEQDSTGDAGIQFSLTGIKNWTVGVDNSDGDKFKIENGNAIGSSNDFIIDSSGRVGIGTTSPTANAIHAVNSASMSDGIILESQGVGDSEIEFRNTSSGNHTWAVGLDQSNSSAFSIAYANAAGASLTANNKLTLDTSGNLLVGDTSATFNDTAKTVIRPSADNWTIKAGVAHTFNRTGSDGDILEFYKTASTKVGSIGVDNTDNLVIEGNSGHSGIQFGTNTLLPHKNGAPADNLIDLGEFSYRFDDIFATNGTIVTSDANEKQQIAALTDVEMTAAKAISALFKTFKWNSAVEAKGDAARTHAGVIAQDVQAAMTAAGLDAGDYAFFISSTWWETQTEVPAVEAVDAIDAVYENVVIPAVEEELDEDGNVIVEAQPERIEQRLVSEAIEAVEAVAAYTRTDTYDTAEEAPEGATERTRMGIRYPELLAFIGAATEQRLSNIETRLAALESN